MNQITLISKLGKYPVFNLKNLAETIGKEKNYAKLVLFRLKKRGLVFEIEKNKYTVKKDAILVSSNIIWPSYISGWGAIRYYNLTDQLPINILIISTRKRKKREIILENTKIIFTYVKPKYFFGYKKERYGDFNIFVAEKEKALIDSALLQIISFSEISEIIKNNLASINTDLLIEYLIKIKNKTLIKRFGFLLDSLGIDRYDKFKKFIDFKYVALDYSISEKGKKNKKWKVIDNVKL